MAIQVHKKKQATNPTAGPVVTPAPDARDKSFGRENYGSNAFSGASSLTPGQTVESPLATDLRSGDDCLDRVQAAGTARHDPKSNEPGSQTRDISDSRDGNLQQVPAAFGMKGAAAGPTIPAKLGTSEGAPERQPPSGSILSPRKL